jgi:uncharacterized protein (DUF3084 family)
MYAAKNAAQAFYPLRKQALTVTRGTVARFANHRPPRVSACGVAQQAAHHLGRGD